ncbi:NCS1 nucleoside transporter [Neolentinus lepideus HHB14362 ss-1]|uniref:NCS1 nucleoside transporter n=1 Tax=Neolentinus lepideus HHB14362 ss-1 TaxID=1314782 RepID=A0A165VTN6_9AGAM|nr:NCS1 nucleoside transporter [Neolentinus lepideus HHB14362 ss-1]
MAWVCRFETKEYREGRCENRHQWLDNDDLRPIPVQDRTYTWRTYFWFWLSANATPASFYGATTALAAGLSLWEGIACQLAGQIIIAAILCVNGRAGSVYHISYPAIVRASFGVWGGYWPVINRVVMTLVWTGVNAVQGGQCTYVMLHAIFPSIARIPDVFPANASALNSGGLIGFAVFWIMTTSFLHIEIPKLKWYIYIKLVFFVMSCIGMLAWTVKEAGGIGPVARQGSTVHGIAKSWIIAQYIWIYCANCATYASNAADFMRYAKKPNNAFWPQLIGFPLSTLLVGLLGNIVGSTSQVIFGDLIWNPITLLDAMLTRDYSPRTRAAAFFLALGFMYSSIFSSIFENSIPAGNDLAALWPRFITIRRGFYITAVVSYAMCPWYILGTASSFVSWLASYQIFLSAITGVMLCQYYIISRGHFIVPDLYTTKPSGLYWYSNGWNYRAYVAYVLGIAPNFYGFLGVFGVHVTTGAQREYYFAYPIGLIISFMAYWGLCILDPPKCMSRQDSWKEPSDYVAPEDESMVGDDSSLETTKERGNLTNVSLEVLAA